MDSKPLVLAIETSCDETAVAVMRGRDSLLSSEISSQILLHRKYGGVVPEVASRNHLRVLRPIIETALEKANVTVEELDVIAATSGPGLASSLLVGLSAAKGMAAALGKPFIGVNHMEGHLLSPFLLSAEGVLPCLSLIVSGGHTMLIDLAGIGDYRLLGKSLDDAAGEAFDKVGKLLGLPYPGGPEVDKRARHGDCQRYDFPRSMLRSGDFNFSFSGLKTSVRYRIAKLEGDYLDDVCASFQEAVVDVLVAKTLRAAQECGRTVIGVSGGVSCNSRLREAFTVACDRDGIKLVMADAWVSTDNAAMIAGVAVEKALRGEFSDLSLDINPNLALATS